MISVALEVRSGGIRFTAEVKAESIKQAIRLALTSYPSCEVRLLCPIDPEAFFVRDEATTVVTLRAEGERLAGLAAASRNGALRD